MTYLEKGKTTLNSNITPKKEKYLLRVGELGEERLNILNNVFNPYTYRFLETLNLKPGMQVLEIGCGTGEVACWLSSRIGSSGKVMAIDINEEQIKIAKKRSASLNLKNIHFQKMSAFDIDNLSETFDLIYSRFVLTHISSPHDILEKTYKILKTGGRLSCEESDVSASFCYPENLAFNRWREIWNELKKLHHLPLNIGLKLPSMIRQAGFKNICCSLAQPILSTAKEKSLLRLNVMESLDHLVDTHLITHKEGKEFSRNLEALEKDNEFFIGFVRNTQVSAER